MTRIASSHETQAPENDPFRYGYREVRRRQADGSYESLRLPLTLWDLLHPQETDKPMHGMRHATDCFYLWSVIRNRRSKDKHSLVLQDTPIYWDIPGLSHHSPDVSVIFDVEREREDWPSFFVAVQGVRPVLLIEVVSPSSRENDVVTKVAEYHKAMVPWYVIVDRQRDEDWPSLLGYRYAEAGYAPLALDADGCLLLEPLGLKLGTIQNRIVLYDAETGAELGDYDALAEALEAEMAARKAAEEKARLAVEQAQLANDARKAAEDQARQNATARKGAEEQARKAEAARADLERQLLELQARFQRPDVAPPDAPAGGPAV
jgi:colicin import membrane protein